MKMILTILGVASLLNSALTQLELTHTIKGNTPKSSQISVAQTEQKPAFSEFISEVDTNNDNDCDTVPPACSS